MEHRGNVLVACGERDASTCAALTAQFGADGYRVVRSEAVDREQVHADTDRIVEQHGPLSALVYLAPAPVAGTVLDGDGATVMAERVDTDLAAGAWWIQAASLSMLAHDVRGRITLVGHITAAVPTQPFSYSSNSQLALMNLGRAAALELASRGVRVNTVLRGWDESQPAQVALVERLRSLHQEDGVPLLRYTTGEEVATTVRLLSDPTVPSLTGAVVTLDGGYYISRKIRYS